jgi:hypothetical protein
VVAETERDTRFRPKRVVAAAIGALVVLWIVAAVLLSLSAYQHDKAGLALLEQVRTHLSPGDLTSSGSVHLLDQAHAEFSSAGSDLSSPFFAPISIVPVVGRQLRSVRSLSTAAGTVAAVGSSFLTEVHGVIDQPHGAGFQRVESLRKLAAISAVSASELAHVDTGPSQALIAPLASKQREFVAQLDDARRRLSNAAGVSAAVATILQGPQTYLVLASNNAEMRAGSGAFLDVGVATTSDGSIQLGSLGPSSARPLNPGQVAVTGDLEHDWGWLYPSLDYRNLGLTPQFDVTAPLAARMWTAQTGQPVDGVLALDVVGLRQLLEASGPVEVGGQTITAGNVEQFLLHDQYVSYGSDVSSNDRDDALGALAGTVLRQLQGETLDLKALAASVSTAVDGRHLMIWSEHPATQAVWVATGVSGRLTADSLDSSVINLGGNKLDQYLGVRVSVTTRSSSSSTTVSMTTLITNTTPSGQVPYIAGPFPGNPVPYGGYVGLIAANLPARATDITMEGGGVVAVKSAEGPTWLVVSQATIDQGTSVNVVTRFVLRGAHGSMTVVPSARVPAEHWTVNGRSFDDTASTTISW